MASEDRKIYDCVDHQFVARNSLDYWLENHPEREYNEELQKMTRKQTNLSKLFTIIQYRNGINRTELAESLGISYVYLRSIACHQRRLTETIREKLLSKYYINENELLLLR